MGTTNSSTDAITSKASLTGGKITESLITHFFKGVTSDTTAEILGAVGGGIGALIVGAIIDDFVDPPAQQQMVDYAKIDAFVQKDIKEGQLSLANSGVYKTAHYLFNNYTPLRVAVTANQVKVSDLVNLATDLTTALSHTTDNSYLEELGDSDLGPIGIPIFMYAVALEMGIYQERYKLYQSYLKLSSDPGNDSGSSLELYEAYAEPNTGTIANNIKTYIGQLQQNWAAAIQKRIQQVTIDYVNDDLSNATLTVYDNGKGVFSTTFTRPNSDFADFVKGNRWAEAENFCNTYYYPKIASELCQQMGYPDAVADAWSKLITEPMGTYSSDNILDGQDVDPDKLKAAYTPVRKDHLMMEAKGVTTLNKTDRLYSLNRAFYLEFAADGNLQLCRVSDQCVFWSTNLPNSAAAQLTLTSGGDLQLLDQASSILWNTKTTGDNYVFLQDNGILQVKKQGVFDENSGSQILWNTKVGMMPKSFAVDTNFAATTYIENNPLGKAASAELGALVFKGNNGVQIYTGATVDGVNWVGPFEFPARMTTQTGPAALGFNGGVITLFKGNGNNNIYLNSSNPYIHGFGGLVTLDENVGTGMTPAALGIEKDTLFSGTALNVIYRGSGDNTNIYQWQMDEVSKGDSGTMSHLQDNATPNTPQCVHFDGQLYLVYRELNGDKIYYKAGDNAPVMLPTTVNTTSGPALVVCNDKLYVIYRGAGADKLWYTTFDGTKWSGIQEIFPNIIETDAAPTAFTMNNQVYVFAKRKNATDMYCAVI